MATAAFATIATIVMAPALSPTTTTVVIAAEEGNTMRPGPATGIHATHAMELAGLLAGRFSVLAAMEVGHIQIAALHAVVAPLAKRDQYEIEKDKSQVAN